MCTGQEWCGWVTAAVSSTRTRLPFSQWTGPSEVAGTPCGQELLVALAAVLMGVWMVHVEAQLPAQACRTHSLSALLGFSREKPGK